MTTRQTLVLLAAALAGSMLLPAAGCGDSANKTRPQEVQAVYVVTQNPKVEQPKPPPVATAAERLVPLRLDLPASVILMAPKRIKANEHMEGESDKPPPPLMVPADATTNLALGKPVTSSDLDPIIGELKQITDGDKDGGYEHLVELVPDKQWAQIDLGASCPIYAIAVWHYYVDGRVCRGIVIQLSDDPDFASKASRRNNLK
jgi:hypothetical protein